uniref:RRM domain-containing protein n=1 Tax=Labrus bergylta TaxID=56723 RepID=A0A3Q3FT97_9LABR
VVPAGGLESHRWRSPCWKCSADSVGSLGAEQNHLSVPVSDHGAWATAMNNLGIMPMGISRQPLVSESLCIQRFEPGLGLLTPINPMMAGISLVPPPPIPPDMPVIKEIIHCKSCTLFPQNPSLPPPSTRERPPGCKTVFVGGLPENATEEIVREVFDQCGEITAIRKSKKNFCHIRYSEEFMVDKAIYLSGESHSMIVCPRSVVLGRLKVRLRHRERHGWDSSVPEASNTHLSL